MEVSNETLVVSSHAQRADAARPRPRNLPRLPANMEGLVSEYRVQIECEAECCAELVIEAESEAEAATKAMQTPKRDIEWDFSPDNIRRRRVTTVDQIDSRMLAGIDSRTKGAPLI
jgi:hypothetical protein